VAASSNSSTRFGAPHSQELSFCYRFTASQVEQERERVLFETELVASYLAYEFGDFGSPLPDHLARDELELFSALAACVMKVSNESELALRCKHIVCPGSE